MLLERLTHGGPSLSLVALRLNFSDAEPGCLPSCSLCTNPDLWAASQRPLDHDALGWRLLPPGTKLLTQGRACPKRRHLALMLVSCHCLYYQDAISLGSFPDSLFFSSACQGGCGTIKRLLSNSSVSGSISLLVRDSLTDSENDIYFFLNVLLGWMDGWMDRQMDGQNARWMNSF